ncbi:sterile alpha motif domain-containing 3-like isoform X2 [Labeo rohita]|uniref:Sterile alpha motif domain-containing 3-like isoform X2 n=1 Tax=Labeo rohita TaxID=84645 RepID=A0A498NID8_LABRO|nr:sterile alpha motif domain-containing 3-like isoform X2 [Labeo rohita]
MRWRNCGTYTAPMEIHLQTDDAKGTFTIQSLLLMEPKDINDHVNSLISLVIITDDQWCRVFIPPMPQTNKCIEFLIKTLISERVDMRLGLYIIKADETLLIIHKHTDPLRIHSQRKRLILMSDSSFITPDLSDCGSPAVLVSVCLITATAHNRLRAQRRRRSTASSVRQRMFKLCDEVDRMHSSAVSLSQRFKEGFTSIVPKVLELQRNTPLAKIYKEAREEMLAEDLPDSDFRAALILLPHIFKEKAESLVTLGECDADNPYPTIQLVETDWKMAFSKRVQVLVKADGVEVCRGIGVEEGILAAFSAYYVFNLAYPPYMKNTLTFLQHAIAKITEVFLDALQNQAEASSSIIGQFGVGFYSAFTVADKVDVYYQSAEPEVVKYSNFVSFPIFLN